jgi:adenosylmethionine-8-amino-7-oxononanoate aminotransferase
VTIEAGTHEELQRAAREHLWLHFSTMESYREREVPVIVRGEGCYLYDSRDRRYLDMLAGLFAVQIGYSHGEELGEVAAEQMRQLPFYTNWTYAHPPAIELAEKLAEIAPANINRFFFVSGGSEANEAAWKLARQYHAHRGQPMRRKVIARKLAYHGTTAGALAMTGITSIRTQFEPLLDGVRHVSNTNRYRCKYCAERGECTLQCADEIAETIEFEGPETVAMVTTEPVQNAGGTFTPHPEYHRRVREICDTYGVLQHSDEVICAFGRLGEWFGATRYGFEPDLITTAKGITSAYQPLGAVMISDKVAEPFQAGGDWMHGITFGGHPVATAVALRNIQIMEREDVLGNVRRNEAYFDEQLQGLLARHEIVGDVRGTGYFKSLELVKDKATRETFNDEECDILLRGFMSEALYSRGLICRADDRGDPVIQLSPPLIAGRAEIDECVAVLDEVLPLAAERMQLGSATQRQTPRRDPGTAV